MNKKSMYAKFKTLIAILILLILFSATVYSHPGRTDANGGHYVRTAGWGYPVGSYHYHNETYTAPSTTSQPTTNKATTQPITTKPTTTQKVIPIPATYHKSTQGTNQKISTTDSQNSQNTVKDKNSSINNFVSPINSSVLLRVIEDLSNKNGADLYITLFGAFLVMLWSYIFIEIVIIQKTDEYMSKKSSKKLKTIILILLRILAVLTSLYATYWFLYN